MKSLILDKLHRRIAASPGMVSMAVKMRNQLAAIIKYSRATSIDAKVNGEAWLVRAVAPKSRYFIDVGANTGLWTELFLDHAYAYQAGLCYEPSKSAHDRLKERLRCKRNLELICAAVGCEDGEADFFDLGNADECSSLVLTSAMHDRGVKRHTVPVVSLDSEITRTKWPCVDFVKIDAEGYDFHVIRGLERSLRDRLVGVLQFEYNDTWRMAGSTLGHALHFLESCGYRSFLLGPQSLMPARYEYYGEYYGYSNYVSLSPDRYQSFRNLVSS